MPLGISPPTPLPADAVAARSTPRAAILYGCPPGRERFSRASFVRAPFARRRRARIPFARPPASPRWPPGLTAAARSPTLQIVDNRQSGRKHRQPRL